MHMHDITVSNTATELDCKQMVEALHTANGEGGIRALMPGGTWLAILEGMLASPIGQAGLQVLEGFIQRGLLVPSTSSAPK